MERKLGIITFHDTNNYGSWLQTYALYSWLKNYKIAVEVINYQCEELINREKITIEKIVQFIRKNDVSKYDILLKRLIKQAWFRRYTQKYMHLSHKYTHDNICSSNNKYDAFMIGSDLVWDTKITGSDFTYMLDFAEKGKFKCSYAASLGDVKAIEKSRDTYRKLLDRFQYITVRELDAREALEGLLEKKVYMVSDPTLLLPTKKWVEFVSKENKYGKYVLVYFLDDGKKLMRLAKNYAHKYGYRVIFIADDYVDKSIQCVNPPNISEFLSLIYYAEKVFTASYHGMLFSLYFNKQIVYSNRQPESRMKSIGRYFLIEKHEIHNEYFDIEEKINYDEVNEKIMVLRRYSENHLKRMINMWRKNK